ncbi:MAG: hypothetical protein LBQ59_02745 [Candidatus Peribacteria bacterium]|nr:hypothetical protein [Candidatus Peribacteria bacterium]
MDNKVKNTPILNSFPLVRGKDEATSPCHSDECQNNVIPDSIPGQSKCKSTFFQTSPQPSPFEGEGKKLAFPSLVGERVRVRVKTFSFKLLTFNSK